MIIVAIIGAYLSSPVAIKHLMFNADNDIAVQLGPDEVSIYVPSTFNVSCPIPEEVHQYS
jgi:hypothetical protein